MKIVWLCSYPMSKVETFPDDVRGALAGEHPATWLPNTLKALANTYPELELHVVNFSPHIRRTCQVNDEHVRFTCLKSGWRVSGRNIPPYRVDFRWGFPWHWRILAAYIRKLKPDLIHVHGTEGPFALAAMETGMLTLITLQGIMGKLYEAYPDDFLFRVGKRWEKKVLDQSRYVVSPSRYGLDYIKETYPGVHARLIENPVNPVFFEVPARDSIYRRLLFIGRLSPPKGIEEFLGAMVSMTGVEAVIVGEGESGYVQSLRESADGRVEVDWKGHCNPAAIAEMMWECDALVLPSYMDTAPTVVMEAMAAGLPVIATHVGGIPGMVQDEVTGFLVEPRNADSLKNALLKFYSLPIGKIQAMGKCAKAEARKRFHPDVTAAETMRMYEFILKDGNI